MIAVALIVIALLIAGVVFVGSRQTKLPPPFGPAANGLITYAQDGDIFTVDPLTGVATAITTGPETDIDPEFSLDGTKILFARQRGSANAYDILVANADGSGARVVTSDPLTTDDRAHLTSDGSAVIATRQARIQRIDVSGGGQTKDIAIGRWTDGTIRATDDAILFENDETPGIDLWVMQADGSDKRLLWDPHLDGNYADLAEYRWSPDGTRIAYTCSDPKTHLGSNVCVMNADGSDRAPADERGRRLVGGRSAVVPGWAVARLQTGAAGAGQHRVPQPSDRHGAARWWPDRRGRSHAGGRHGLHILT